ncbi:MAG TPA: hypothetical protein VGJ87_09965 [Roseiflexaceae bacterium]|jgi:hypothetical protein
MRWTKRDAHLQLLVGTELLNEDLRTTFNQWYPGMADKDVPLQAAA